MILQASLTAQTTKSSPTSRYGKSQAGANQFNFSTHITTTTMARKAIQTDQIVKLIVGAGQASPSPPVGPALGSKGVKSMDFCKVSATASFHRGVQQEREHTILMMITGIQRPHRKLRPRHPHPRPRNRPPRPQFHLRTPHTTHRIPAPQCRRCRTQEKQIARCRQCGRT